MKKTLSIILAVLLLISAFPFTAFAADTDTAATGLTVIDTVTIYDVEEPVDGYEPEFFCKVNDYADCGFTVKDIKWYAGSAYAYSQGYAAEMDEYESRFIGGNKYTIVLTLESKPGETEFVSPYSDMNATVNGNKATVFEASYSVSSFEVCYTFTCKTPVTIDTVTVTDVVEPVAGEHPDEFTATVPENAGYKVLRVYWKYDNKYLDDDDTFIEGKEYTASVWVDAIDGETRFPLSNVTATLNGHSVTDIYYDDEGDYIKLNYVFTCASKTVINTVAATIDEPVAGEAPSYTGAAPEGAGYTVGSIVWWDENDNNQFGAFEAGKEYTAMVVVSALSGYKFDDSHQTMQGTINGEECTFQLSGDSDAYAELTFTCAAKTVIDSLAVTGVVAPVAGQNPTFTASVPEGSGYRVYTEIFTNGVNWFYDGLNIDADDVFVAGREYEIEVSLVPVSDEYVFADAPSCTVNGEEAEIDVADPGQLISVLYTFTCPANTTVLYTADVTIDEPIAGQAPSIDGGSVPEGAGYTVGVVWSDEDGNNDFGTFEAGKEYSAWVVVYAKSGYKFDDTHLTMQGTVNGAEKTFLVSGDSAIYVACTFTCEGEPELLGDVDGDGEVSVIDATIIQRYEAGFNVPYAEADILRRGDVDDDGEAGVIDATLIQRFNAGFNVAYPIGEPI